MTDIVLSPVPVSELVDRIATELEERMTRHTPPAPLPDRLSLEEAIMLTGLTRSTIYKLTMDKSIPFAKYGKRLIFSRRELREWIEKRTVPNLKPEDEMAVRLSKGMTRKKR